VTKDSTKVTFLLSKDPDTEHGGDIALSRLVIRLAAEAFDVSAICLSDATGELTAGFVPGGVRLTRVSKPAVSVRALLPSSLRKRRSLVHVRYDTPELVAAIEASDADTFAVEHSYMAESLLHSRVFDERRYILNTVNTESQVWRVTRGILGRVEAPRITRDEIRVARAAEAVGTYDLEEADWYRGLGVPGARWIDLTMEPIDQLDLSATSKRLVFMGTRDWPPNQEAFLEALKLWPRISAGIPDAELAIIGAKKPGASDPHYPPGVRDLGFVDDLPAFLSTCRALIAPVKTGGGVRVKILDAARMGLPVVGTTAAVGSLGSLFGLGTFDDDDEFVAECRRHLQDSAVAVAAGDDLYGRNSQHWRDRRPHRAIEDLLLARASLAT
jgi:glycosyltransferase involved in cell wall biosynthesis